MSKTYRYKDETNSKNIKMLFASVLIFFSCIAIVFLMSVIFGMGEYSSVVNPYDRPRASYSYHDHRI